MLLGLGVSSVVQIASLRDGNGVILLDVVNDERDNDFVQDFGDYCVAPLLRNDNVVLLGEQENKTAMLLNHDARDSDVVNKKQVKGLHLERDIH